MNWLERLARRERKRRKQLRRRTVRAYRQRQKKAGIRRVDVALTTPQYAALAEIMRPGETFSMTVGRMIDAISGNGKEV